MIPTTSPCFTSKETSLSAQISSFRPLAASPRKRPRTRLIGALIARVIVSRRVEYFSCGPPIRYIFPRFSTRIATLLIRSALYYLRWATFEHLLDVEELLLF